jgi:hypothetical protein
VALPFARPAPAIAPNVFEQNRNLDRAWQKAERDEAPAPRPLGRWLTIDEAIEHSHLTRAFLLKAAETGAMTVLDMGKGARGGRWRFYLGE